jgi:hypothetical protein
MAAKLSAFSGLGSIKFNAHIYIMKNNKTALTKKTEVKFKWPSLKEQIRNLDDIIIFQIDPEKVAAALKRLSPTSIINP